MIAFQSVSCNFNKEFTALFNDSLPIVGIINVIKFGFIKEDSFILLFFCN